MAKKSLGQNFLKSIKVVHKMISTALLSDKDEVLEIGPGKGFLTKVLLSNAKRVIAIEKDAELIPVLQEKFADEIAEGKFLLIEGDALKINPRDYFKGEYKLISNIPYYITGAIIERFLSDVDQPKSVTLLVQKEVAKRIVARDEKESILSISVKVYGVPKYVEKVSKREFSPSPKVDSAILHIYNVSKKNFENTSEEKFFELVKVGFAQKRKKLLKNLHNHSFEKEKLEEIFESMEISPEIRAERLTLQNWLELTEKLTK